MHSSGPVKQPSSGEIVRFGVFEADMDAGELRCRGKKVSIQELPFRALKLLISHPHEVLSREDFRQALWPDDVFVDFDSGVITAIKRVRDALGDSATNSIFVETVGRGYRWIAPVHREVPGTDLPGYEASAESVEGGLGESWKESKLAESTVPVMVEPGKSRKSLLLALVILAAVSGAGIYRYGFRSNSNRPTVGVHHPANHEAGELYLQGRFYWNKRTPESLTKAVDFFTQAIVHDPGYAQAYMGLADSYNLLREYSAMPATEAYPRALAAAKKAVELDDQSSQAHASLAFVSFYGMWDVATADREFRRAIALDPNNAVAHHWYATYLLCLRRFSESLTEIERAQALDPTSNSVLADKGSILFDAGRRDEAVALLKQVEEAAPNFRSPHQALSEIYLITGDYPNYLVEARKVAATMHDSSALAVVEASERAFATGGGRAMLLEMMRQQKKLSDQGSFSPVRVAQTFALLGEKREALFYLEKAYKDHADAMAEIETGPTFQTLLHSDPGYQGLVAKIGLPAVN